MANNRLSDTLMHAWMRRGWLACLLSPIALVFGTLLLIRTQCYRFGWFSSRKLRVPVIVVGNIFVGGTGKTPFTIWLLQQLKQHGFRPGVISRGYGSDNQTPAVVLPESSARDVGDEPTLIAQQGGCPVVVGRNRYDAGTTLLTQFPDVDVILADDGLQHYALQRDVEIILFDARGVGNGWLLPAGPLREPIGRARDFTVLNLNPDDSAPAGMPPEAFRMTLAGDRAVQLMNPDQVKALHELGAGLRIVAAAGIGNPERFFAMLRGYGLQFTALPLPDHFNFDVNPFANLKTDLILITDKDAVKCRQFNDIASDARIYVVGVQAEIEQALVHAVVKKLTTKK
jgi:tetraacyldisaccharide 4'-kinase